MNLKEALDVLEIENISTLTLDSLKKRYHKKALQNHPDKNGNTPESTQHFQRIQEAYELLKREISILNGEPETQNLDEENVFEASNAGYTAILHLFIDGILKGKYNEFISNIVKDIASGCREISLKLFEDMNKEQSLAIYNFIVKYKQLLRISDDTLDKVREILLNKFKDMQIYVLNPSINDLFQNNVYKLDIDNKLYFVPLWHSEMYFDSDIIVKCNPELPDNVEIDEENNLIITERISHNNTIASLFFEKSRPIKIGDYSFELPMDQLFVRQYQTFILRGKGISKIVENNIYEIEDKADIIVKIIFE
jgi:curved DNA-binding protein CbpA